LEGKNISLKAYVQVFKKMGGEYRKNIDLKIYKSIDYLAYLYFAMMRLIIKLKVLFFFNIFI
jgi:hypothetical protein